MRLELVGKIHWDTVLNAWFCESFINGRHIMSAEKSDLDSGLRLIRNSLEEMLFIHTDDVYGESG